MATKRTTQSANTLPSGSLGEFVKFIWENASAGCAVPCWPPDVFAITGCVLARSGAYTKVLDVGAGRSGGALLPTDWPREAEKVAKEWRAEINVSLVKQKRKLPPKLPLSVAPKRVREWWQVVTSRFALPFSQINDDAKLVRALICLCTVADEASAGTGTNLKTSDDFIHTASLVLTTLNGSASFGLQVRPDKVAVMAKQHTPQRGLTFRSLSHHLALYSTHEISVRWLSPLERPAYDVDILNILLLPWPETVRASDFTVVDGKKHGIPPMPSGSKFFCYEPRSLQAEDFATLLHAAIAGAKEHVDRVHCLVFPELALTEEEYAAAEDIALAESAILIAGVLMKSDDKLVNASIIQPLGLSAGAGSGTHVEALRNESRIVQGKHHRWCLDRNQVIQYGLGGRLPASKDCWELTNIEERSLVFFTLEEWLTWSVLICEDLARQDPATEVLRAVAPNMVIALLMDGPQLRERWPSRYASVLADDPGCSVLTLTSLGMARRSKPRDGAPSRSGVIGLWKDVVYGERELSLADDEQACVLSLVCKTKEEYSADGRGDRGTAHFPVFAGLHPIKMPAERLKSA